MRTYRFELNAQRAEFGSTCGVPFVSVAYGRGCTVAASAITATLPDALAELGRFANAAPAPCRAFLRVARGERTPPGFLKAATHVDNKGATS